MLPQCMYALRDFARRCAKDEDDSEAGLSTYEQQKAAWRSEQDALNFPDEVRPP